MSLIKLPTCAKSGVYVTEEGESSSLVNDTLKVYHHFPDKELREVTEEIKHKDAMVVSDSTGGRFLLVHAFRDTRAPVYSFRVPSELEVFNQKLYVDGNQVRLVRTGTTVWLQMLPSNHCKKYCRIL